MSDHAKTTDELRGSLGRMTRKAIRPGAVPAETLLQDSATLSAAIDELARLRAENQRLTAERDDALKLAYIGEHRFPDLTWKARCEEAHQRATAAESALPALRERCAEIAEHERGLYLANAQQCDRSGNATGGSLDAAGALACERVAAAIRAIPIEVKT